MWMHYPEESNFYSNTLSYMTAGSLIQKLGPDTTSSKSHLLKNSFSQTNASSQHFKRGMFFFPYACFYIDGKVIILTFIIAKLCYDPNSFPPLPPQSPLSATKLKFFSSSWASWLLDGPLFKNWFLVDSVPTSLLWCLSLTVARGHVFNGVVDFHSRFVLRTELFAPTTVLCRGPVFKVTQK